MKKAALHNLGCKVNAYETQAMRGALEEAGYLIVDFCDQADVYVINTCSVTNMADRKSRQMLHRAKKQNPDAVIVAVGCYVQAAGEKLKEDQTADILIGNDKKGDLVSILADYFAKKAGKSGSKPNGEDRDKEKQKEQVGQREQERWQKQKEQEKEQQRVRKDNTQGEELLQGKRHETGLKAGRTRGFIKIQDGCNQFCSYCLIPYLRGRIHSRNPEEVEQEVGEMALAGYREVVLTGIHLSSYGVDRGEKRGEALIKLLWRLHHIEGLSRIRLGSLEPGIITESFVRELSQMERLCPHFHLSLQSGCDSTLKRMNRHYSAGEYEEKCILLREAFFVPAITTDVIVGFPGETEAEFSQTRQFLQKIGFYEMHIFKYSVRGGTRAAVMPNQIPEEIKSRRSDELITLEKSMSEAYRRGLIGRELQILLEEQMSINGKDYMVGFTKEYVKAAVPFSGQSPNTMAFLVPSRLVTPEILAE